VAGGDWFDAIPMTDGQVALMAGDVPGHGVSASAAMGHLHAVLNELLVAEPGLTVVLARADAFAARSPALRAATLALAVLDPSKGTLSYATCGHLPPWVAGADGNTRFLPLTGPGPFGAGWAPTLARDALQPGDVVALYSNGLVVRPAQALDDGMAQLARAAAAANRTLLADTAPTRADPVRIMLLTRGAKEIRTPDLLHACDAHDAVQTIQVCASLNVRSRG
jgi:serine phosphatase RsbU (regulator of sigma subunit)